MFDRQNEYEQDQGHIMLSRVPPALEFQNVSFSYADNQKPALVKMNLAVEAGRKLGVQRGTIKGDMILTDKGAFVIEIATRLSGGWLATDQIPLATGIDIIKVAIKIALGEKIDLSLLKPRYKKGVAIRYFFPKPGKIISIQSKRLPKKDKRIHKINFFAKENDTLEKITNHSKRAGFVITVDKTREDAINLAEKIVNSVNIKTEII